jgi:hypothetical protein
MSSIGAMHTFINLLFLVVMSPIPEPSAYLMVGAGLALLVPVVRRRRRFAESTRAR